MSAKDSNIVKFFGTTDEMFLKAETTRVSATERNMFFEESMSLLIGLNQLYQAMMPEEQYIRDHQDEMFAPGEYVLFQITQLEEFVSTNLSVEFVSFTETQVPTKPVAADKMYIFVESYRKLWDRCNDAVMNYDMDEEDAKEIRNDLGKALYNLSVFLIIQFNLECAVLSWATSETVTSNICSTVIDYCDKVNVDMETLVYTLRNTYDLTRPKIDCLEEHPTKHKEFIDMLKYVYFDLVEVPELVTIKVVNDILAGRKPVDEYVMEISGAINKKYEIE